MQISIEPAIRVKLPHLLLSGFACRVNVAPSSSELKSEIDRQLSLLAETHTPESIREMAPVKATKDTYRALGKDPNRYRPSAEALLRRVANGRALYDICNVVDILNLISATTGFSIGGYDVDNIMGAITLGVGEPEEPYVGIGRGDLNIESLPVFRDSLSAFGSPTSDSVRTMVSPRTTRFLMVFVAFEASGDLEQAVVRARQLLMQYAGADDFECFTVSSSSPVNE
ncbi:DNA/RNA-binding domain of Phe-tRNA-synthetase-like protein [Breznakibacter xylanolyticus]|uniref:DNA/RNA-binding domain of Phe-tRNA-synthetase-like protein n=1 Tax=Breznakibacter xylanolyticus TaxID=990 RepID=A0A2W7NID1_9BACT|nr:phenylalanine--tRNA ligase beta subunit-related protein [Breznakibacter xylanolyticus]PZX17927.1 DNA/RNA-binding domain of Phe-tRNA-synthetase-like protein [Breznakibacter xylanolyticus]